MTNAWIQRFAVLGLPLLFWFLAARYGYGTLELILISIPAIVYVTIAVVAIKFIVMAVVNRADQTPRPIRLEWLKAYLDEVLACCCVFAWWQPFCRTAVADQLTVRSGHAPERGIVLVHGFLCNRALWTRWLRVLQAQQRVVVAVDLEPAFGSIDAYMQTIDQAVRQVRDATGGLPPVVVGHSMGGLALRAWWAWQRRQPRPLAVADLHHMVTIGTPHHGTWLASWALVTNGGEMRQDSAWLRTLEHTEKTLQLPPITCFYSQCDNIVFPVSTACLERADNRLIRARGHIDLLHDAQLMQHCWTLTQ
jgi:triacylglycerol lipase